MSRDPDTSSPSGFIDGWHALALRVVNSLRTDSLAEHDTELCYAKARARRDLGQLRSLLEERGFVQGVRQVKALDAVDHKLKARLAQFDAPSLLAAERVYTVIESVRAALLLTLRLQHEWLAADGNRDVNDPVLQPLSHASDAAISALEHYLAGLMQLSPGVQEWRDVESAIASLTRSVSESHALMASAAKAL